MQKHFLVQRKICYILLCKLFDFVGWLLSLKTVEKKARVHSRKQTAVLQISASNRNTDEKQHRHTTRKKKTRNRRPRLGFPFCRVLARTNPVCSRSIIRHAILCVGLPNPAQKKTSSRSGPGMFISLENSFFVGWFVVCVQSTRQLPAPTTTIGIYAIYTSSRDEQAHQAKPTWIVSTNEYGRKGTPDIEGGGTQLPQPIVCSHVKTTTTSIEVNSHHRL